jgi:hypothetical protein
VLSTQFLEFLEMISEHLGLDSEVRSTKYQVRFLNRMISVPDIGNLRNCVTDKSAHLGS